MKLIRRIFGKQGDTVREVNELTLDYLQILPRCFKEVCIVSPVYGESTYTCEIVIPIESLIPWTVDHAESTRYSREESALMKAFLLWLRGADKSLGRVSYLPAQIQRMIQSDLHRLVPGSKVYCFECYSFVEVNMTKKDERRGGNTAEWTDIWTCPDGHSLYYEQHESIWCK